MRRLLCLAVLLGALAGCGDDDETAPTVTIQETVTTAESESEPIATVPAPHQEMPARCATEGLDVPGLINLAAEGVECREAEGVLRGWLEGCAGRDGPCETASGYTCNQQRFAGSRSDVECVKAGATVRFSFD